MYPSMKHCRKKEKPQKIKQKIHDDGVSLDKK